ncbi:MAG: EAL domain-containing protein, partial [Gammaproteobacteria bacterium]|nr:EAL domain-containing protein [Gammaproteobacteria bacterium]
QLAQHLKMSVVVEGVEYAEQIEVLKRSKVDLIQGYFYSKPLAPVDFLEFYNAK